MSLPRDPLAHIKDELLALPEAERTDYALDLIAFYLSPQPLFFEALEALGLDLPLSDKRVLFALDQRRGQAVGVDSLLAARYIDQPVDDWGDGQKVARSIHRIKPQLVALGLPVQIDHVADCGYMLRAPREFRFEDAAPVNLFSLSGLRA